MLGYIQIAKPELKIKEYDVFRSYYCGLCHQQGKSCSQICRLGLSYDFAFLALLLSSVYEQEEKAFQMRCLLHPLRHRRVISRSEIMDYCAKMSVLLTYYKLKDDLADNSINPLIGVFPFFAHAAKKISKEHSAKAELIAAKLAQLSRVEKENCRAPDIPAGIFGELTAGIFDMYDNSRPLAQMGYDLGRWLYFIDALDDYDKDKKKGSYNPIDVISEEVTAPLWYNLSSASAAFELLDTRRNRGLLENIVYIGLKSQTDQVIKGKQ